MGNPLSFEEAAERDRKWQLICQWSKGLGDIFDGTPTDTERLDWADANGHYDARYKSARDELDNAMAKEQENK